MGNIKLSDLANRIIEARPDISYEGCLERVEKLYSCISEENGIAPDLADELFEIELDRIDNFGKYEGSIEDNAASLIGEYSSISFYLARQSLFENKAYIVAELLGPQVSRLYDSDSVTPEEKNALRSMISETELDFIYATGSHAVASLRMAPTIKAYKKFKGN